MQVHTKAFKRKKRAIICSSDEESDSDPIEDSAIDQDTPEEPVICTIESDEEEAPKLAYQDKMTYFNLANPHELMNLTSLTADQAGLVQELRPFADNDDIQERLFSSTKGKSISKKFDSLIQSFETIDEIISACKSYFSKIKPTKSHHISAKPRFLSRDITLKSYQVTGVNWLLSMYYNDCGVILADEVRLGLALKLIL